MRSDPYPSGGPDGYTHLHRFLADLKSVAFNPNQPQNSFLARSTSPVPVICLVSTANTNQLTTDTQFSAMNQASETDVSELFDSPIRGTT